MRLQVFDPALCCSTGICGVDPDPELARVQADLAWLATRGVTVERHNLGQDPVAFAAHPLVRGILQREGVSVLPLLLLEGEVVHRGGYPSRATLASLTGALPDVLAR
jgi:hypothetical protein